MLDKFKYGMLGLAAGDSMCRTDGKWSEETQISLIVSKCLIDSKNNSEYENLFSSELAEWGKSQKQDNRDADLSTFFAAETKGPLENGSTSQIAFSLPVGFYFYKNIPKTIEYARSTCAIITNDSTSQCCAVSSALMGLYALLDVPVGLWGNELTSFVRGIDDDLLEGIRVTTLLCAKHKKIDDFNKYIKAFDPAIITLCGALFCCMSYPNNSKIAIQMALKIPVDSDAIAATVGGCLGAKIGNQSLTEDQIASLEDKNIILETSNLLFNGSNNINAV